MQLLLQRSLSSRQACLHQPPPPTPFSLTPGVVNVAIPWDYSTSSGIKLFFQSTAPVTPAFEGTEASLKVFLKSIGAKARTFGWETSVLLIPDNAGVNRSLLQHYGMLTIANVNANATTYLGTDTRAAQASAQLAACVAASLGESVLLKLLLRASEYTIGGAEDGPSMLKTLISVVTVETRATVSSVRTALKNLTKLMNEVDSNITEFNVSVGKLLDKLHANDQTCEDLLNHLFEAYQSASDRTFVAYVADKESKWEDSTIADIDPATLMTLAEEKFKTLKLKGLWNAPTKEEASILAMRAEFESVNKLVALRAEVASLKVDAGKTGDKNKRKARKDGDWAWKLTAPTGSQPKEKTFKGKAYIYCAFHGDTKWVLKSNHADGCRNDPANKAKADAGKDDTVPTKKSLQYARALMHAMGEDDEEEIIGDEIV